MNSNSSPFARRMTSWSPSTAYVRVRHRQHRAGFMEGAGLERHRRASGVDPTSSGSPPAASTSASVRHTIQVPSTGVVTRPLVGDACVPDAAAVAGQARLKGSASRSASIASIASLVAWSSRRLLYTGSTAARSPAMSDVLALTNCAPFRQAMPTVSRSRVLARAIISSVLSLTAARSYACWSAVRTASRSALMTTEIGRGQSTTFPVTKRIAPEPSNGMD